ncbi:TPA: hypothetical protein IF029_003143 [Escherichia coli]|nr:hypothetical protein [Escherichia coli]
MFNPLNTEKAREVDPFYEGYDVPVYVQPGKRLPVAIESPRNGNGNSGRV